MEKGNMCYLVIITLVASLGGLLFGFDMAIISRVLPFMQKQFSLTTVQEGWFVSSALVGFIVGVPFPGELSDRFGRKTVLFLSAFFSFVCNRVSINANILMAGDRKSSRRYRGRHGFQCGATLYF